MKLQGKHIYATKIETLKVRREIVFEKSKKEREKKKKNDILFGILYKTP